MRWIFQNKRVVGLLIGTAWLVAACTPGSLWTATPMPTPEPVTTHDPLESLARDADVPELPFPDNPDPLQCGIPTQWGLDDPAWLTGYYEGELVQPTVFLYDSHLRLHIAGAAPMGAEVRILLYQANPVLDFYLVRTVSLDPVQEGWVPAPFLSFEPAG